MNDNERNAEATARQTTADDIDPRLLAIELDERNRPTADDRALEISVLWGDTVVSEVQVREPGPVTVGTRTTRPRPALEVDGGFPVESFTVATLTDDGAQIIVPSQARVAVRSESGRVDEQPALHDAGAEFAAKTYRLQVGERIVYKSGTLTVMAQFVRGSANLAAAGIIDWIFPAIFTISALLHVFFVVATFIAPDKSDLPLDELFKNQPRFAQMILEPRKPDPPRKKLDLSGKKDGAKAKEPEGKFGKTDRKKNERAPSKPGAPRVDPKKRERDRKIAMSSGLFAVLGGKDDAVSEVLGPGGLGTGINEAMGSLRGTEMGDAGGTAGLGTRGRKGGGGGGSLNIGGLGTRGRGAGGNGDVDLGRRGKRRTKILPGRTIIKGSLKRAEIARVIQRNLPRFKFCYEKQLTAKPNLGGKVSVQFTIAPTGSVARASVRETSMNDTTVETCVVNVMRSLKFPKPKGGGIVVVTYPFVFAAT